MFMVLSLSFCVGAAAYEASAAEVDADIFFVIDNSGSMGGEFDFLAGAIGGFLADLQADARIGSARAGLITFNSDPTLVSDLNSDAAALSTAFSGVSLSGGAENAYGAVDSAVPGGNTDFGLSYGANTVKSVILITDEDADDLSDYANSFGTGESALAAYLASAGFLNNIIHRLDTSDTDDFDGIARPAGGLFDIEEFRDNREGFFDAFTRTKIAEITQPSDPGSPNAAIPVPAALPLLLSGIVGFGLLGWRRGAGPA
jgi:hypothetical protein